MKKEYRIKKNKEIEEILKNKKYYTSPYFIIYKKFNETSHFRYAISVGKKIGNAVTRNRIKRQVTAIIDNLNIDIDNNIDIFIIVRTKVLDIDYENMKNNIKYLLLKLKVIKGDINE